MNFDNIEDAVLICQQLLVSAKKKNVIDSDGELLRLKDSNVELDKKVARLSAQLAAADALNAQLNSAIITFETQKTLLDDVEIHFTFQITQNLFLDYFSDFCLGSS